MATQYKETQLALFGPCTAATISVDEVDFDKEVNLETLVTHRFAVQISQKVEDIYDLFKSNCCDFIAVMDGPRLFGLCSRQKIGMLLGSRYGFSLFARKPVAEYTKREAVRIIKGSPVSEVLATVFSRKGESFYDDVLLMGEDGQSYLGVISTENLVRLQNRILIRHIQQLNEQQRENDTKNQQIEQERIRLKASEENLAATLHSIGDGVIACDVEGRVVNMNHMAQTLTGWSLDNAMGRPIAEVFRIVHGNSRDGVEILVFRAIAENRVIDSKNHTILLALDGFERHIAESCAPIHALTNEVVGAVLVFRDVTKQRLAEAEIRQYEIQLRHAQKLESIGTLAAGIAHEINTPIQFVLNNVLFLGDAFSSFKELHSSYHQLLERLAAGGGKKDYIADIQYVEKNANLDFFLSEIHPAIEETLDGIERVRKIVHAMKDFSHPGTEQPALSDLNGAINSTLTVCRSEWKKTAEVVTCFDPDLPLVPCFSSEINQVILNVVVNASHAIADVVNTSKAEVKGVITVATRRDGDWAEVRISDTGNGIPEKARSKIFDPFFTTKGVGKGTGLGLSIAHAVIAKKHRGSITFETELGRGTTFIIRLPLSVGTADLLEPNRFY